MRISSDAATHPSLVPSVSPEGPLVSHRTVDETVDRAEEVSWGLFVQHEYIITSLQSLLESCIFCTSHSYQSTNISCDKIQFLFPTSLRRHPPLSCPLGLTRGTVGSPMGPSTRPLIEQKKSISAGVSRGCVNVIESCSLTKIRV